MRSVELFGGAGGLALGAGLAGFEPSIFVEWDKWACDTVRQNADSGFDLVKNWNVYEGDVRAVDWQSFAGEVDLVTGGPPCQPFSMGGNSRAADDSRDMFPAAVEVVRAIQPRAFILENVRGLTRSAFANYYQLILLRLQYPELISHPGELWLDHLARLQAEATSSNNHLLQYNVLPTLVNAADYGVPQQRHRVFIVGFRSDVDAHWSFPAPTHSLDALLLSQWFTGEYWDRHKIVESARPEKPKGIETRIERIRRSDSSGTMQPWRTVRDALEGLSEPKLDGSGPFLNHFLQLGARSYPGHTGSPLDMPAKTLKAGAHGVPGGENMMRNVDGSVRYFSIRESARLQTFPDTYELHGSWSEAMRQLGNAVPVDLARITASSVSSALEASKSMQAPRLRLAS
ncbi:DNA cytosine methyltransferase [Rhodoglobus aureus]|uniref:DNA (cytosine-5-)-methyltransferase n=1 Tax=Rhodoglobus aureus TaxID=191497 RepID=A0ABP4GKT9_9MICO